MSPCLDHTPSVNDNDRSSWAMVDRRWATTSAVEAAISRHNASCT